MTITQHGPRCDVCDDYILPGFSKSINPFSIQGIDRELHCHDKCKVKVEGAFKWEDLPAGPLRTVFEEASDA